MIQQKELHRVMKTQLPMQECVFFHFVVLEFENILGYNKTTTFCHSYAIQDQTTATRGRNDMGRPMLII